MSTIVVVDDEPQIRALVANSLSNYGFAVHTAGGGGELDQLMRSTPVDLVLLDVMMPGEDGLSICRRIAASDGPDVILLSALNEEHDRIVGLEVGAGHYLAKPCSPREIVATVRAALRRRSREQKAPRHGSLGFAGWRIDIDSHQLFDPEGVLVDLTDGEFAVLRAFVERPRRVLSREMLLETARGPETDSFDRAIDVQVSRLRRKLNGNRDDLIRTVRNEGYLFTPQVLPA
jgi:two-component system OmpR family response regulator